MDIQKLIDGRPVTGIQYIIIVSCFLLNMLGGVDVVVMSYVAPRIIEEWGVPAQAFGLVFSAALIGMAAGAMFVSPYTDVIGRRNMILLSIMLVSVGMLLTVVSNTVTQLAGIRFFTGLGIGAMLASLTSLVSEYSPNRVRNFAIGFMLSGYSVGATLTGVIASWLIPEYGWRSMFILGGLISTVLLPVILLILPESLEFLLHKQPRNALEKMNVILKKMKCEPLHALPARVVDTDSTGGSLSGNIRTLVTPERRNSTLKLWSGFFMAFFTLYFLVSWIPKIAEDTGLTATQGSYAGAFFNFGSTFGIIFLGFISSVFGLKRMIFLFMLASVAVMVIFGLFSLPLNLFMLTMFVLGFFAQGGFVGMYSVAARLYPMQIRTTGIGWGIGLGRFGAIISPALGGIAIGLELPVMMIFILFAIPFIIAGFAIRSIKSDSVI